MPAFAVPALLKSPMAKWLGIGLAFALAVLIIVFALDRYGDARYREGEVAADAKWQKASEAAERESVKAAGKADDKAAVREADFAQRAADEKAKLDETTSKGGDPFDVLFGADRVP